jgi:hypothetical protein
VNEDIARPSDHESAYIPSVQFRSDVSSKAIEPYIKKKLRRFFRAQEDIDDLGEVHEVAPEDAITDIDFGEWTADGKPAVPFKYLYEVVMEGISKEDGSIDYKAYTLTFDHELTDKECNETGTHYGTMTLGGEPVLYYVRLSLPKLIAEARSLASDSRGYSVQTG